MGQGAKSGRVHVRAEGEGQGRDGAGGPQAQLTQRPGPRPSPGGPLPRCPLRCAGSMDPLPIQMGTARLCHGMGAPESLIMGNSGWYV